jgi:superfamily II DNA or RNA helicase
MNGFLFDKPMQKPVIGRGFTLRDYQAEDCDEACDQWEAGNNHVLCVHATGLGKSLMAAELASRKPKGQRAIIIVDSTDLSKDLYRTVQKHTGKKPGIVTGDFKENWNADILIATKQCLCAGQRYKRLAMHNVDRIIVDECEAALADEYIAMLVDLIERKPDVKLIGLTATPLPASNRSINDLFDHCATEPGPLYRDLQWAYLNGWLVKPMQGILRCSLDFASLKVRKQESGEKDYSDKDIAKLMLDQDERQWLELAGGIYQISKNHTSIVVCPNSTLVADKLAGYIEGAAREEGHRGFAYSIHRRLGKKRSTDMMHRFKAGEFPCAVSVRMFEKGFDYDGVNMVVMVRRTKSLRLYTQVAGRGTRPLTDIRPLLGAESDPKERMRIIAESYKPSCVIVDCVGINDDAKDILGVIDILGRGVREDVKERVRQYMIDRAQRESDRNLGREPEEDEQVGIDVGDEARKAVRDMKEELERERRARLSAKVEAQFEIDDKRRTRPQAMPLAKPLRGDASDKMVNLLIAFGVKPDTALSWNRSKAGMVIKSYKERNVVPDWSRVRRWERSQS